MECIENYAFSKCSSLKTVSFPQTLKTVNTGAFGGTGISGTVCISSRITDLSFNAFSGTEISAYEVSEDNKYYSSKEGILMDKKQKVIYHCPQNLKKSVYAFPETVEYVNSYAFSGCKNLKNIIMSDSIEDIGIYTFSDCTSLESVKFPSNLKGINETAFAGCESLNNNDLPSGLKSIDNRAFAKTAVESLNIPESVTYISDYAFELCKNLKTVKISPYFHDFEIKNNEQDISIEFYVDSELCIKDGVVYSGDMTCLINYPVFKENETNEFTVPDTVTKIGEKAFEGTYLSKITLSENISEIGDFAFGKCEQLEEIDYKGCSPKSGKGIFSSCILLYRFELPENIFVIPEKTFEGCTGIYTAKIPDGITEIEDNSMPENLKQVYIPSSVTKISDHAFYINNLSVICGKEGSQAEKYAADNSITFITDKKDPDGDVNGDGSTNILDLISMKSYFLSDSKDKTLKTDINEDGKTSITDLV